MVANSVAEPNWKNRTLFHADNLDVLRSMNSESVDLIATDPPFNKSKDFHSTPDKLGTGASFHDRWDWNVHVHPEWVKHLQAELPALMEVIESGLEAHSQAMGAYLCYMSVRLLEMHRVLKPTGSIYLHCDPTASHYLKACMDAIFGNGQFKNELIWRRLASGRGGGNQFGRVHDVIFLYTKGDDYTFNAQYRPRDKDKIIKQYRYVDSIGRYQAGPLTAPSVGKGESSMPWRGVDVAAVGRHWALPARGAMHQFIVRRNLVPGWEQLKGVHARLDALDAAGMIYWTKNGKPRLKLYLDAQKGVEVTSVIIDINKLEAHSNEKVGYPTQKPLELYERLIRASSNEHDIVLDPFAGCATTCVAAERLGRQWVGIDIWAGARDIVIKRMERQRTQAGDKLKRQGTAKQELFATEFVFTTELLKRTDDGRTAAMELPPPVRYGKKPWERLSNTEMRARLLEVQKHPSHAGRYICAGCGRTLEAPFFEMDHINPKAGGGANTIDNRILLCRPCNFKKKHMLTVSGLWVENQRDGWMLDESKARLAVHVVQNMVKRVQHDLR